MSQYACPVCGAAMEDPPQDWNICSNCWCEFSGDGDCDAKSGLPIEEYRDKWRRGDFDLRNAEYRQSLEEALRRKP